MNTIEKPLQSMMHADVDERKSAAKNFAWSILCRRKPTERRDTTIK